MTQINSNFLKQFHNQGLSINEGVAVDAGLVKSVNRPVSKDKIEDFKRNAQKPEGKLDKNGNSKKYSRDLDSNWVIKNEAPHYGLKEHAAVDTENGFILATTLSPASHNDSIYLPYAIIHSIHTKDKIKTKGVCRCSKSGIPGSE